MQHEFLLNHGRSKTQFSDFKTKRYDINNWMTKLERRNLCIDYFTYLILSVILDLYIRKQLTIISWLVMAWKEMPRNILPTMVLMDINKCKRCYGRNLFSTTSVYYLLIVKTVTRSIIILLKVCMCVAIIIHYKM